MVFERINNYLGGETSITKADITVLGIIAFVIISAIAPDYINPAIMIVTVLKYILLMFWWAGLILIAFSQTIVIGGFILLIIVLHETQ